MAPSTNPRVADFVRLMDDWAPAWCAESWDRVGLLAGDAGARVGRAWTALELSPALLAEALAARVDLLLLHHPPLFKPLPQLLTSDPATARLLAAVAGGLSLFAAHTNLDAAPGGVNDVLAARLGLVETRPLLPSGEGLAKLVTFLPAEHRERVAAALFAAGAGRIGAYRECAFAAPGRGEFLAPAEGRPFVGRAGERTTAEELRLETILPLAEADRVVRALREAHPYHEPACDLYPLRQGPAGFGLGRVGRLAAPLAGIEFAVRAARELGSVAPVMGGAWPAQVERVAVVGGSGGDCLAQAAREGAQVLLTGEVRHHAAQEAADRGIGLLVLGHFETEVVIIEPWAARLARELQAAGMGCEVSARGAGPSPWRGLGPGMEV